jgi:hypothetical protein
MYFIYWKDEYNKLYWRLKFFNGFDILGYCPIGLHSDFNIINKYL